MKICVIDIGTNSIHVIYAKIEPSGYYEIIGSDKEMVQLGEQTLITKILPETSILAAIECLKRFQYFAGRRAVDDMIVVATSAVREAQNADEFVNRIRAETKLKVHVIDGKEEARLIGLAVQSTLSLGEDLSLILDIGGGSTELIVANQQKIDWLDSVALGSNRLKQMFVLSDPPKPKELQSLEAHSEKVLESCLERLNSQKINRLIGTSGTLGVITKVLEAESVEGQGQARTQISKEEVLSLYKKLSQMTFDERKKIKGVSKKRADMVVQGLSIAKVILEKTNIKTFEFCDKALREGILFDYLQRNKKMILNVSDSVDLRKRSVYGLLEKYNANLIHAEQVSKLSLQLFDAMAPIAKLNPKDREILGYAALLHDIGYHISFSKHHLHSFYLIMNSDMAGFSNLEIETIAWVARFHRKEVNRRLPEFTVLNEERQNQILALSACLRLADAFDSSHFAVVDALQVRVKSDRIQIVLQSRDESKWESQEAQKRMELFEKVFGLKVELKF